MDIFLNYFIPAICLLLIMTLPIYIIRIYMYFQREHYMLQAKSFRLSMYIHGVLLAVFAITLLFVKNVAPGIQLYIFGVMCFVAIALAIGYKYHFSNQKSHRYSVFYSKWNNRKKWQKHLEDNHLGFVDVDEGSFSFVSYVNFSRMEEQEINKCLEDFKKEDFLHPLNTKSAYYLLAFQVFMLSITLVAYVLFFVYLPML